jgi:hypothetical protein
MEKIYRKHSLLDEGILEIDLGRDMEQAAELS